MDWIEKSRALDRFLVGVLAELRGHDMPGEVRGLSEMVRSAKAAMSRARQSTEKLAQSARDLHTTLDPVEAMIKEIDAANRELQSELATMSNGSPPLDDLPHGPGTPPSVAGKS